MVRIAEGKPIPQREGLGDDDRNDWETDSNGTPQDPWQVCNTLPMKDPETGQDFFYHRLTRWNRCSRQAGQ